MARSDVLSSRDKLGVARLKVWDTHPYLMEVLFKLKPVERKTIETLAVDEGLRLYYNPGFVESAGDGLATVLIHECQHILRGHPALGDAMLTSPLLHRYNKVAPVLREMFGFESFEHLMNICGDLEINDDMKHMKWPDPQPLVPASFKMRDGLSMTEYVAGIIEMAEKMPPPPPQPQKGGQGDGSNQQGKTPQTAGAGSPDGGGNGDGDSQGDKPDGDGEGEPDDDPSDAPGNQGARDGSAPADSGQGSSGTRSGGMASKRPKGGAGSGNCGGCAGHRHADEELSEGDDVPEPTSPEELEVAKRQVAHAVMESNARGTQTDNWILAWAKKQFERAEIDWRKVLAAHIVGAVSSARGNVDWKVGPPSRRREILKTLGHDEEAPILPVLRGPEPKVTFVLDTSGSMGSGPGSRLDRAIIESYGLVRSMNCLTYGLACDAQVKAASPVRSADDLMKLAKGGGGTDMRVGIKAAESEKQKPDVIVVVTDAETPWPTPSEMPKRSRVVVCVIGKSKHYFDTMPKHLKQHAVFVTGGQY